MSSNELFKLHEKNYIRNKKIAVAAFSYDYQIVSINRNFKSSSVLISVYKPSLDNPDFSIEPAVVSAQTTAPVKYTWKI